MTDPAETLRAYQQRVQEIAARAGATRTRLAALRPAVTSPDGAVTVTVSSVGALVDLSFGPAAERRELAELARLVVTTAQAARAEAARQTESAVAELVGEQTAREVMSTGREPAAERHGDGDSDGGEHETGYRGRGF